MVFLSQSDPRNISLKSLQYLQMLILFVTIVFLKRKLQQKWSKNWLMFCYLEPILLLRNSLRQPRKLNSLHERWEPWVRILQGQLSPGSRSMEWATQAAFSIFPGTGVFKAEVTRGGPNSIQWSIQWSTKQKGNQTMMYMPPPARAKTSCLQLPCWQKRALQFASPLHALILHSLKGHVPCRHLS